MTLKPVLVHVDAEDWSLFKEICGNYKVSKRVRELVREDIERESRERVAARVFSEYAEA